MVPPEGSKGEDTEKNESTEKTETVNLVTVDGWFIRLSDRFKFKCFKELATVKFYPDLNIKSTEQTHKDLEKATSKKSKKRKETVEELGSYYLNIAEELNDFDEWCISEQGVWGIPIPYFTYKNSTEILMDSEIARHFATLVR